MCVMGWSKLKRDLITFFGSGLIFTIAAWIVMSFIVGSSPYEWNRIGRGAFAISVFALGGLFSAYMTELFQKYLDPKPEKDSAFSPPPDN